MIKIWMKLNQHTLSAKKKTCAVCGDYRGAGPVRYDFEIYRQVREPEPEYRHRT